MYKKQHLCLALCLTSLFGYSQGANQAKALLDEVYNKIRSYNTIYMEFTATLENTEADLRQETRGNVTLKGDKYLLDYMGAQQLYDGENVYTVIPENEEVTIERAKEDGSNITPSQMLTFYKTGHTYEWDLLQNAAGRKIQYVKVTPIDSNAVFKFIFLGIDVQTKHIYRLIQVGKNDTKTIITLNTFKTNLPLSKTLFTFNEKKYEDKGYYIVRN